jgi:hypothetical protein
MGGGIHDQFPRTNDQRMTNPHAPVPKRLANRVSIRIVSFGPGHSLGIENWKLIIVRPSCQPP